jgi:methionyl aminopeptidase
MSPRFRSSISLINKFAPRVGASNPNQNPSGFVIPPIKSASVPDDIPRPPYARNPPIAPVKPANIQIHKDPDFIKRLRKAGEIAALILDALGRAVTPGVSTADLDDFAIAHCKRYKCYPSPLDYQGFPRAICTSVNEVVCHGIPNPNVLNDGDIITIDVTIYHEGVHADCAATFPVGYGVSAEALNLVDAARTAAACAAATCVPNATLGDIGKICDQVAERFNCMVLPTVCGHGVGENFHEPPTIAHSWKLLSQQKQLAATKLQAGMTLTVEPALALAGCSGKVVVDPRDGWTVRTADGKISAQFEHTLLVTERGPQIITAIP